MFQVPPFYLRSSIIAFQFRTMTKKNPNKAEVEKLLKRKKEENEALRKMLQKLNSKNNKVKK